MQATIFEIPTGLASPAGQTSLFYRGVLYRVGNLEMICAPEVPAQPLDPGACFLLYESKCLSFCKESRIGFLAQIKSWSCLKQHHRGAVVSLSVVLSVATRAAWQGNQKVPGSFDPKPPMLGSSWDP